MKKKVLFWLDAFDRGGIEKVTLDLVNNLNPNKYEITVMQMFKGGYCRSQLKPHIKKKCCFPLFANGVGRCFYYFSRKILYKIFIREKYDIEIADGWILPSKIIGGSTNKKSKKIAWIHMDVLTDTGSIPDFKNKSIEKEYYNNFNRIVCVSEQCLNSFVFRFGEKEKSMVLYNAIPEEEIIEKSKEEKEIIFDKNYINIITVGAFRPQKGYDRLLPVHERLIKEGLKHRLYILGDGGDRAIYEKYIKDHRLENSVIFLGFQYNPYKYIVQADFFVCSSRHEAFSTVQAEATILGIPIVTTDCNGTKDLLGNSEYGLIVENSEDGLYEGIKKYLLNPDLVQHYREKALVRKRMFSIEESVKKWENLLDE